MFALFLAFANAALFAVSVNADLVSKPRDTEAVVGDSTYFDCASNVNRNEVNWFRYAVGSKDHEDICIYCLGKIHPLYKNRLQVERDVSTGNFRLRINSVQLEDAGRYLCQDNGGIGESATAQLVVLESNLTCTSNIKPDGFLGPNSCDIEPDELHLSCNVSYKGNIPPLIQWRDNRTLDPVDKGFSCDNIGNQMTCIVTKKTDLDMNGASYICGTNRSATTQYNCTSDIIRIIYAKTDKSAKEMIHGSREKVNCSANSSQTCSYLWKWFDGVNEEVVSNGSVLTSLKIGWHKCEASCSIHGKQCTVLSRVVYVSEPKTISDRAILLGTCLPIMAILPFLIFCIIRRRGLSQNLETEKHQLLVPENSSTKTDQLEIIRINSSVARGKIIYGLASLEGQLFVVRQFSARVEVYDIITFVLKGEWNLKEKTFACDIASCTKNKCLYVVDCNAEEILRLNPNDDGSMIKKWSTGGGYGLLSVTPEANILLAVQSRNKIKEYSPEGQLLREIRPPQLGIYYPRHAVKLNDESFLISAGSNDGLPQGILIFNGESIIASSVNFEEHQDQQLITPLQMCVNSSGSILVIDKGSFRVLLLNSALEFQKELISWKDELRCPFRICLDESNGTLFVANNSFDFDTVPKHGEILVFKIKQMH